MGQKILTNITENQLKQSGVQALADRPNAAQQYGQSGLSATQLKLWFDKLATLLSKKINELQNALQSEDAAQYIVLALGEYETLDDLIEAMQDGGFAENVMKLYRDENAADLESMQSIVLEFSRKFAQLNEDLEHFDEIKISKNEETADYRRVYGVDKFGNQILVNLSEAPLPEAAATYNDEGALKARMSESGEFAGIANPSEVVNLNYMNALRQQIGTRLEFSMDSNYVVSLKVFNTYGTHIYTANLDLPLEDVIVNGSYVDGKIILSLRNGNVVEIPVANMVNGLVTEAKHSNDIKILNDKIDASLNAYIVDVYQLLGGDYVDYS